MTAFDAEAAFKLVDRIGHAFALLDEVAGRIAGEVGLPSAELVGLVVLESSGTELSQADWGRLQGVSRQRAHVVARSLGERGLIMRRRAGRESLIALTSKGERLAGELRAAIGQAAQERLAGLSPDGALRLSALLGSFIEALEATRE